MSVTPAEHDGPMDDADKLLILQSLSPFSEDGRDVVTQASRDLLLKCIRTDVRVHTVFFSHEMPDPLQEKLDLRTFPMEPLAVAFMAEAIANIKDDFKFHSTINKGAVDDALRDIYGSLQWKKLGLLVFIMFSFFFRGGGGGVGGLYRLLLLNFPVFSLLLCLLSTSLSCLNFYVLSLLLCLFSTSLPSLYLSTLSLLLCLISTSLPSFFFYVFSLLLCLLSTSLPSLYFSVFSLLLCLLSTSMSSLYFSVLSLLLCLLSTSLSFFCFSVLSLRFCLLPIICKQTNKQTNKQKATIKPKSACLFYVLFSLFFHLLLLYFSVFSLLRCLLSTSEEE